MAIVFVDTAAHAAPRPSAAAARSDSPRHSRVRLADRRDPSLETLATDAAGLPPELAADALIRIASSARVTDRSWRRELLDEAFIKAYGAADAYRRAAPQTIPLDTRQGTQQLAYAMSLNRVSLQVRAAQLMAFTDPARARELFEWIDLDVNAAPCEELLVPAVDEYYGALSLLARTTFGDDRAEALRFLELFLWRARLPSEMPAVARAMQRFAPRPAEAAYLESLFGFLLETGASDARGFSTSALDIVTRTADLQVADGTVGPRGIRLQETLRAYLILQMKGPRCADSVTESMTPASFNAARHRVGVDDDVQPIDGGTLWPSKVLGTARLDRYWQLPEAKRLHETGLWLRGPDKEPLPLKTRQTVEWRNDAERFLTDIDQWTGSREPSARDFFCQKSLLFIGLLELMPSSTVRSRAVRSFVDFLRHEDDDRQRQALWFAFLNRLLEMAHGNDRADILTALENAHHPTLSVYARLERLVPVGRR